MFLFFSFGWLFVCFFYFLLHVFKETGFSYSTELQKYGNVFLTIMHDLKRTVLTSDSEVYY